MTNEFFFKEDATFCEFLVAKYQFLINDKNTKAQKQKQFLNFFIKILRR